MKIRKIDAVMIAITAFAFVFGLMYDNTQTGRIISGLFRESQAGTAACLGISEPALVVMLFTVPMAFIVWGAVWYERRR